MSGAPSGVSEAQSKDSRWQEWPMSSQGPYVTTRGLKYLRERFELEEKKRSVHSKTRQQVFLITEVSGYGEASKVIRGYATEPQLSDRFKVPEIRPSLRVFTACSEEFRATMDSSYIHRVLYECNAPASVAVALRGTNPSGFGTYLERRPEGDVNHMWIKANFQWACDRQEVDLWREPHQTRLRSWITDFSGIEIYSGIYVAYRSWDDSATALVVGLTSAHDELIEAFKSAGPGIHGGRMPFILLRTYLSVVLECAKETGDQWRDADWEFVEAAITPQSSDIEHLLRSAEKRNRFATYGRSGVLSLQAALVQIQAHYQTMSQTESWPEPSGLNMTSSFLQMLQSLQEMQLAFEIILQTSKTQLDVLMGYSSLRMTAATGQMARDAREDSEIMKTITVVTMIYLPATFAATVMSMGIFDFYFPDGPASQTAVPGLRVSPKAWLYAAIAAPLTIVTLALAYAWTAYTGRKLASGR